MESLKKLSGAFYLVTVFSSVAFERGLFLIYLNESGVSLEAIGWLQVLFFLSHLFGEIPTGWFSDSFGRKKSLVLGLSLMSFSVYGQYLFANEIVLLALAFTGHGLSFAFLSGAANSLLFEALRKEKQSTRYLKIVSIGRLLSAASLGSSIILGGTILQYLDWGFVFGCSSFFLLLGLVPVALLPEKRQKKELSSFQYEGVCRYASELFYESKQFFPLIIPLSLLHGVITLKLTKGFILKKYLHHNHSRIASR